LLSQQIFNIFIFIIIYKPNNFGFVMFWNVFFYVIKKYINEKDSYWLKWLLYLFMIDEHIISIKSCSNSFNATCDFNTKTHFSKREILMNCNVQDELYNGKQTQDK